MSRFVSHPSSLSVLLGLLLPLSTGCNNAKEESFQAALARQNELLTSQQQQVQQMTATIEELRTENQQAQAQLQQVAEQNELLTSQQQQMQQMTTTIEQLRAENQRAQARLAEAANQRPEIKVQPEIRLRPTIEYQPPPRKEVDLIIHSVSVYADKDNGSPWDDSGPPDLKVRIVGGSAGTFTTSTQRNTTYATFNVKATRVAEGDEIQVEVLDSDVLLDDTIGTFTKQITAATMQSGTVNWTFGRVASLVLEFQP
jgi:hypothetical protein